MFQPIPTFVSEVSLTMSDLLLLELSHKLLLPHSFNRDTLAGCFSNLLGEFFEVSNHN